MRNALLSSVAVLTIVFSMAVAAQTASPAKSNANLARGKYLVEKVGMCADCHTPMDKTGQFIKSKHLQGSVLVFKPIVNIPTWMPVAPGIAGLNWTDEQAIEFFTTGKRPNGTLAAPPMPQFRLSKADAAAVAAYLKSLKP